MCPIPNQVQVRLLYRLTQQFSLIQVFRIILPLTFMSCKLSLLLKVRSSRNGLLPIAQLWTRIPTPLWYHFYTRQTTGD